MAGASWDRTVSAIATPVAATTTHAVTASVAATVATGRAGRAAAAHHVEPTIAAGSGSCEAAQLRVRSLARSASLILGPCDDHLNTCCKMASREALSPPVAALQVAFNCTGADI